MPIAIASSSTPGDDQQRLRVVGPEGDLEGGQVGKPRQRRQQPLRDRVEEDQDPDRRVEDRLDQEGGGNRRIGGVRDLALDQEDLGHVAGVGGDDRVDPGPGEVGGGQRGEGDALARVGGAQHVAPGPGTAELHRQQEAEGDRERRPADVGEVGEERGRRVEEGVEAGARSAQGIAARLARSCQRPRRRSPLPGSPRPRRRGDVRACPGALHRRPQEPLPPPAQAPRRAAQPDHHRRPQVRHDQHPPLPRPPSRDPDVEAEGAQLLRRRAQLGPRPRLVREPLRQPLQGARRVLPALHEPAPLRGGLRADQGALPRRPPALHGARPDQAHPLPLGPRDRRGL